MLAAKYPNIDKTLETIGLTLLLKSKREAYADRMMEHLVTTSEEAVTLLEKPSKNDLRASSEAVSLAFSALIEPTLRQILDEVIKERSISPEQAKLALDCLEIAFDPRCKAFRFNQDGCHASVVPQNSPTAVS